MKVALLIALMLTATLCGQSTTATNSNSGYGTEVEVPVEEQAGNNVEVEVIIGDESTIEAPTNSNGWTYTEIPLAQAKSDEARSAIQWGAKQILAKVLNCTGIDENGFSAQLLWAGVSQQSSGLYWQFVLSLDNSNGVTINATVVIKVNSGETSLWSFKYVNQFSASVAAEVKNWQISNTCAAENEEESTQEEASEEELESGNNTEVEVPVEEENQESTEEECVEEEQEGGNNTEVEIPVEEEAAEECEEEEQEGGNNTEVEVPVEEENQESTEEECVEEEQEGGNNTEIEVPVEEEQESTEEECVEEAVEEEENGNNTELEVPVEEENQESTEEECVEEEQEGGNNTEVEVPVEEENQESTEEECVEEAVEEEESGNNTGVEVPVEEEQNEEATEEEQSGNNTGVEIVINSTATCATPSNYNSWIYTKVPLSECNTTDILAAITWGAQIVINKVVNCTGIQELTFTTQPLWVGHYKTSSSDYYQFVLALDNNNGATISTTLIVRITNGEYSLKELHYKNVFSGSLASQIRKWQANNTC